MVERAEKSFSLLCDMQGRVLHILHNEDKVLATSIEGNMIFSIVAEGDLDKILNFFLELNTKRVATGWEINVATMKGPETYSFFGGIFGEQIGIAASTIKDSAKFLFSDLDRISNDPTEIDPSIANSKEKIQTGPDEPAVSYYEELSRLNNELVNMQRELAKKNHKLDELNKLKNQFLGIAAHDLRNPIGIIMGYSRYLLEDLDTHLNPEQIEMLKSVLSSSEFMLRLLDDLLDISAIESGNLKLNLIKKDLVPVIRKNVELNNVIAHRKNITINFNHPENIPEILFDLSKIEQVLNNLISNAVKYSHQGTIVNVSILLKGNELIISVADQGQGIPEAELEKLFKPFEITSVQSTAGEKSTGLGLSIVRNLIIGHKGKIWVESKVGQGSTFFFSLPLTSPCIPQDKCKI
jgi:signal transduction histidine kinase